MWIITSLNAVAEFGGSSMKHFIGYLVAIFLGLFVFIVYRNNQAPRQDSRPIVKIYAYSSFVSQWGAGPVLKEIFERTCDCRIEFVEAADATHLIQKMKFEGQASGADVVMGLDQFDLEKAKEASAWKSLDYKSAEFDPAVKSLVDESFAPMDWGVMSFVFKKTEIAVFPTRLDDLLSPELKGKIALEDPRTSSPGLQFLLWVLAAKGEEAGFEFFRQLNPYVHSYSSGWSTAYGLFNKEQARTVFSYNTSPLYHQIEEKKHDVISVEFQEGHPVQVEFMGIPELCRQCDLAEKWVSLVLSAVGQKVLMEKNYMFPAVQNVKNGTAFADVPSYKLLAAPLRPTLAEKERLLEKWSELRH